MTNVERNRSDKRFIQAPGMWPAWPFLPIKRSKSPSDSECSVLIDTQPIGAKLDPEHKSARTVILANMFSLKETLPTAERKEYPTVDDMLADGWMVD